MMDHCIASRTDAYYEMVYKARQSWMIPNLLYGMRDYLLTTSYTVCRSSKRAMPNPPDDGFFIQDENVGVASPARKEEHVVVLTHGPSSGLES